MNKMNKHFASPAFQIRVQGQGTLSIVCETPRGVLCVATEIDTHDTVMEWDAKVYMSSFAKNLVVQPDTSFDSKSQTLIFEYNLKSELRNPQKLLRKIRKQLIGAIEESESFFQTGHELEFGI